MGKHYVLSLRLLSFINRGQISLTMYTSEALLCRPDLFLILKFEPDPAHEPRACYPFSEDLVSVNRGGTNIYRMQQATRKASKTRE